LGFFLALSFYIQKNQKILFISGFMIAVALHGFYNFAIMEMVGIWQSLMPLIILVGLAGFTTWGFRKLKKLQSICKISS
jgi:RsiW-degrading membrane proteinase PrsW (M82 family)